MHILFLGYGKTSQRVAKQLFELGHQITTISSTEKTDHYAKHLIQDVHALNLSDLAPIDWVYVLLSPQQSTVEAYRKTYLNSASSILNALKNHPVQRIVVVSSTRVYGENAGGRVDDETPISPQDEQGKILEEMEQVYLEAYAEKCTIIRPTGIYNGVSQRMIGLAEKTKAYPNIHWSNRIHIGDLSGFLSCMLHVEHLQQSYILTNNLPEPLHEKILKIQKEKGFPELVLESQHETGKKIYATRLHETGFELIYY